LPIVGSTTNTSGALETMRTIVFNSANGARPDVKKIGIVITDGQSNVPTQTSEQAELAKQVKIR
jgi:Mg-chelatase subunit ChlD